MRIESSDITMGSARRFVEKHEEREALRVWLGRGTPGLALSREGRIPETANDRLSLSERVKSSRAKRQPKAMEDGGANEVLTMDSKLYVLKALIEKLTGKKITLLEASPLDQEAVGADLDPEQGAPPDHGTPEEGWGISYSRHESHVESEQTVFAAKGVIKTNEGEEISFALHLHMSREFISQESTVFRAGDAAKVDPLVINFDGSAAELTSTKFTFDLDADGKDEEISFVRSGSGILALDIDKNGRINDGSELFGPKTGDGFAELAAYDEDGNTWIDENDDIYEYLSIWTKDIEGNDHLSNLRERGVGAIYLSSVDSRFDLKDGANQLHGQVDRSGIYVEEDGDVKTIQQINMTV